MLKLKITKKRIFFKRGSFRSAQVGKAEKRAVYVLKMGSFGAAQGEKVEALGEAKAEKWRAFARHIPVLFLYGSTRLPGRLYPILYHLLTNECSYNSLM